MKPTEIKCRCRKKCGDKLVTAIMSYEKEDFDKGVKDAFRITCTECGEYWYEQHYD